LLEDNHQYNQLRLLALRKVLKEHTYKERLEYLVQTIFDVSPTNTNPEISVFSIVNSEGEIQIIKETFERQVYDKKKLFLFTSDPNIENEYPEISPLNSFNDILLGEAGYYAFLSSKNYYGKNY